MNKKTKVTQYMNGHRQGHLINRNYDQTNMWEVIQLSN